MVRINVPAGTSCRLFSHQGPSKSQKLPALSGTMSDLIVFAALGVFLGGRLGYVLFYNLPFYLDNPLKIFAVWEGGMSFHGGFLGTCIALWIYSRRTGRPPYTIADLAAGVAPIGLGLGRIGNFINGELFGRPTDVWWCMVFPHGGPDCRHPSQLYQAALEGLLLFSILTVINRLKTPREPFFGASLQGMEWFDSLLNISVNQTAIWGCSLEHSAWDNC